MMICQRDQTRSELRKLLLTSTSDFPMERVTRAPIVLTLRVVYVHIHQSDIGVVFCSHLLVTICFQSWPHLTVIAAWFDSHTAITHPLSSFLPPHHYFLFLSGLSISLPHSSFFSSSPAPSLQLSLSHPSPICGKLPLYACHR